MTAGTITAGSTMIPASRPATSLPGWWAARSAPPAPSPRRRSAAIPMRIIMGRPTMTATPRATVLSVSPAPRVRMAAGTSANKLSALRRRKRTAAVVLFNAVDNSRPPARSARGRQINGRRSPAENVCGHPARRPRRQRTQPGTTHSEPQNPTTSAPLADEARRRDRTIRHEPV